MTGFYDTNYMVHVDVDFNGGSSADIFVRGTDPTNAYGLRLESGSQVIIRPSGTTG